MTCQFQADPRAVTIGLMVPQGQSDKEPCFTDAGLFAMVGALAYSPDIDDDTRLHNLEALTRVLATAVDGGLDQWAEEYLHALFAEQINPLTEDDKGKLLVTLCRLVSLTVGTGRMVSLITNTYTH
jgi:hypothetical protein